MKMALQNFDHDFENFNFNCIFFASCVNNVNLIFLNCNFNETYNNKLSARYNIIFLFKSFTW